MKVNLPVLARGMSRSAPPGSMAQSPEGPFWRVCHNLIEQDGRLRRREAGVGGSDLAMAAGDFDDSEDQAVLAIYEVSQALTSRYIIVTSRELFLFDGSSYHNLTPVYDTGTVSATNGSPTVTGSGTSWNTFHMKETDQIEIDSVWYEIQTVDSDTQVTLTTNFSGTTGSGKSYTIRRVWHWLSSVAANASSIFVRELNGDIYVAGNIVPGPNPIITSATNTFGGIVRIARGADPVASSWSSAEYILGNDGAPASGVDNVGYITFIRGFIILPDGRLVVGVHWYDVPTAAGTNRILFSSHTDVTVWTTSPGGFSDITGRASPITALLPASEGAHCHFLDGVEVGELTGQDDPPLNWRRSNADIGAVGPQMVAVVPGGRAIPSAEVFIGHDRNLHLFYGSDSRELPVPIRKELDDFTDDPLSFSGTSLDMGQIDSGWCRVDPWTRTVSWYLGSRDPNFRGTLELRVNYETGALFRGYYPTQLTGGVTMESDGGDLSQAAVSARVGTWRKDEAGSDTDLIYDLRADTYTDSLPNTSSTTPQPDPLVYAESDDLDLGDLARAKALGWLLLWMRIMAGGSTLELKVFPDGDSSKVQTATVSPGASATKESRSVFEPAPETSGSYLRLRFRAQDDNTWPWQFTRMVLDVADLGDVRTE